MARERIIEGTWDCTSCGQTKILARHKQCPACANPREEGTETDFDFGERTASGGLARDAVTEADAAAHASAGPDWFCAFCETSNRGDATTCRNCSADRTEGTAAQVEDMDATPAMPQALAAVAPVRPEPAPLGRSTSSKILARGCVGLVLTLGLGFCGFAWWLSRTGEYKARVADVSWSRQVTRQTFKKVERKGWKNELRQASSIMPVAGSGERGGVDGIRDCRSVQRGTRQVADGTRQVCENRTRQVACGTTERCRVEKQGNGFAKETCTDVTKYCSQSYRDCRTETRYRTEPVFDVQCQYTTWDWTPAGDAKAEGHDDPPTWPVVQTGTLDRLVRQESYRVVLEYTKGGDTKTIEMKPATEKEFLSWRKGQTVTAVVTNGGELKDVRR